MNLYRDEVHDIAAWVLVRIQEARGPINLYALGNGELCTKLARTDRNHTARSAWVAIYTGECRYNDIVRDLRHELDLRHPNAHPLSKPLVTP